MTAECLPPAGNGDLESLVFFVVVVVVLILFYL